MWTLWPLLMGRLKPGISLVQASTAINNSGLQILRELDASATSDDLKVPMSKRIQVQPAARGFSRIRHSFSKPLWLIMILVALVLLICCFNVANLQLARATGRAREIGLRLAIGASRIHLLRQLMTENYLTH